MISYLWQISSFNNMFSLPLFYHCIPRAEMEAGNACSAWILESGGFQKFWGQEVQQCALLSYQWGSLTKTYHTEITFPLLSALGQTQKAWDKVFPLGHGTFSVPRPTRLHQCWGEQGCLQLQGIFHFGFIVSWVVGQFSECHCTSKCSPDGINCFSCRLRYLH